jgi:hypothetical protein
MRPGFWRKCRVCFRWCRISALLAVLAAVCALVWFNQIGLPDFLKTRLVAAVRERGIQLQFSRMRLRFSRGLVAENVRLGGAQTPGNPSLTLADAQLQLDYRALLHRRLQVDGLTLRQGKFLWPVSPTNPLRLDNIQTDLRFQTNDTWSLDNFQADFAGAKLMLSGDVAHAPEILGWKMFHNASSTNFSDWQARLQKFTRTLGEIHLSGAPLVNLTVNGDARDIHSLTIRLKAGAADARTPWFRARDLQLSATLTAPADAPGNFDSSWDFWTNAQPYKLAWSVRGTQLRTEKLNANSIAVSGLWCAPELAVNNFSARLGGGKIEAAAKLNVGTRELVFTNSSCFNLHALDALLAGITNKWLAKISLPQAPSLQIGGLIVLPAWTNRAPDWLAQMRATARVDGALAFTNGIIFGAKIDSARADFSYSSLFWNLPDLVVAQGKTHLEISGNEDEVTKNFRAHIRGALVPEIARPFLTASNAARGLEIVRLSGPLALDATVRGSFQNYDSIAADGNLAVTNFTVRGEPFGDLTTAVNYTNRVLEFFRPLAHTGAPTATADSVTLDFNRRLIFFTNALTTVDPYSVTRAIGPKTAKTVEPYQFLTPPTIRANGQIPLGNISPGRDMATTDMKFEILKGAPFQWRKLRAANITGTLYWRGQTLRLADVAADFYGGTGTGDADFDFRVPHEGADFNFDVDVTNVNLHMLAVDLSTASNHLEGTLSGRLAVTNGSTMSLQSWNGYGQAKLRDGLLWDIPVISILSPMLNAVSPGLGNSRATEASGKFGITNGVAFTDSLEIRSTMTRLEYSGTIDWQQIVNARITARPLRDTWGIGPVISAVLWPVSKLFEYRVTGTLSKPKSAPVYVLPRLLLFPLRPIRTIEDMIPSNDSVTNRPAVK